MKVTIPRDKWLRPYSHSGWGSQLWHTAIGCGCVMGHFGLSLGISPEQLHGCVVPEETISSSDDSPWPDWVTVPDICTEAAPEDMVSVGDRLGWTGTDEVEEIIRVNDDPNIWDDVRERRLIEMFARHGVELEFV